MTRQKQPWQQALPSADEDPLDTYLNLINQYVYGDSIMKKAFHALLRLTFDSDNHHLTKSMISKEGGLTYKDLYNNSVFNVLSDFGLVYTIEKFHQNGEFLIPIYETCRPFYETLDEPYGIMRSQIEGYERAKRLMKWFGTRLIREDGSVPVQSEMSSRPIEWLIEFEALMHGMKQPIDVSLSVVGQEDVNAWKFVLTGIIEGDHTGVDSQNFSDWIKRKMVTITKASLTDHRSACPCNSLETHLIKAETEEDCINEDDTHTVEYEENLVRFETILTRIKPERGD